jgi:hypothetical protein
MYGPRVFYSGGNRCERRRRLLSYEKRRIDGSGGNFIGVSEKEPRKLEIYTYPVHERVQDIRQSHPVTKLI